MVPSKPKLPSKATLKPAAAPTAYTSVSPNRFDWSLVRSFLAVLDAGSLLGAARRLNTSQPTLGRHVAELESQLGVPLFERTGRGLLPTPNALQVADAARAMETGALQLQRGLLGRQKDMAGTVRLTASQPVACVLLPPILAAMREALPDIQIELEVSNTVADLMRREADIALRMVRPEQASLVVRKVGHAPVGVFAAKSYLARRGTPLQPQDLLRHDLIGGDRNAEILRGFQSVDSSVTQTVFALRTDDLIAQWQAVRFGLGIGFLTTYVVRNDPSIQRILPEMLLPDFPMWLAVHREIRSNRRIRAVFDFLADALPKAL